MPINDTDLNQLVFFIMHQLKNSYSLIYDNPSMSTVQLGFALDSVQKLTLLIYTINILFLEFLGG